MFVFPPLHLLLKALDDCHPYLTVPNERSKIYVSCNTPDASAGFDRSERSPQIVLISRFDIHYIVVQIALSSGNDSTPSLRVRSSCLAHRKRLGKPSR